MFLESEVAMACGVSCAGLGSGHCTEAALHGSEGVHMDGSRRAEQLQPWHEL